MYCFEYLGNFRVFLILLQNIGKNCKFMYVVCTSQLPKWTGLCTRRMYGSPHIINTKLKPVRCSIFVYMEWSVLVLCFLIAEYCQVLKMCVPVKLVLSTSKLALPELSNTSLLGDFFVDLYNSFWQSFFFFFLNYQFDSYCLLCRLATIAIIRYS